MLSVDGAQSRDMDGTLSERADGAVDEADAPATISVEGRGVAYAEYGAPGGDPLVFLHGTPGSRVLGRVFDERARRAGVRVLAPDRPGYGRSEPWPSRTLADAGEFVAAVLDDAGVGDARLVGFSGGGPHALAAAATHGERVSSVDVVAGAVPPSIRASPPAALRLFELLAGRTPRLLSALLGVQAWVAARSDPSLVVSQYTADGRDVPDEVARLVKRDFVEALSETRRGFVTETRLLAREWDVALDELDVPVRLWHGDRDANVPVAGARRLADRLPDARVTVFEEADHLGTVCRSADALFERTAAGVADEAGERRTTTRN